MAADLHRPQPPQTPHPEHHLKRWGQTARQQPSTIADSSRHRFTRQPPFCRWHVPARTRLLIQRNGITDGTFVRARRICRIAAHFLTDLDAQQLELKTASQHAVESYLDRHPRHFEPLAVFLRWASHSAAADRIHPVPSPYADPYTAYPIDTYRAWMRRFEPPQV